MADPFAVSVPAWLERVAIPIDAEHLGHTMGIGLMSLANSFERDPEAPDDANFWDSRKGFTQGFNEVQQDQIDPQWRVKGQLMANKVLAEKAQLATQGAQAEAFKNETSAWMQDAPKLTPWLTAPREQRKTMEPPTPTSKQGLALVQKQRISDDTRDVQMAASDNRLEQARLQAEHAAGVTTRVSDWNDAMGSADPDTFARISALKGGGRQPNGIPTPEAIQVMNSYRRANGMTDYGTKASEYLERPGKLTPEQTVQLRDLEADARDLRKQIAAARVSEPDKVDALQSQLDQVLEDRRSVAAGKDPYAKKPVVDPLVKQREDIENRLSDAISKNDKNAIKSAQDDLTVLRRKMDLKAGHIITPEMDAETVSSKINGIPIGGSVYIEKTGKWKTFQTQRDKDAILSQLGGAKPAAIAREKSPQLPPPLAAPSTESDKRKQQIESLQTLLDNLPANRRWEETQIRDRIEALQAEDKKANGTFKFLSQPAQDPSVPKWMR
jgi:hypothetical protein